MEDDDYGGSPTLGTSTCMSALPLEEELLIEQDDPERVSLPTILFIILPVRVQNLSPPNRTSPFFFILRVHQLVLEMETLMVVPASLATPI